MWFKKKKNLPQQTPLIAAESAKQKASIKVFAFEKQLEKLVADSIVKNANAGEFSTHIYLDRIYIPHEEKVISKLLDLGYEARFDPKEGCIAVTWGK